MLTNKVIKTKFNELREQYGLLLINLKKAKIPEYQWHEYILKEFNEEEISFIFGQNIWKFIDRKNTIINLGKGTKVEIKDNSSRLILSPEKAGILTWICTDGYMSLHRGYYISIKDNDILIFNQFKKFIKNVYRKSNLKITKIKNKNAFQCIFSSKQIFIDLITYIPLSSAKNWTIPIEILDKKAIKEVLRILTHTEGSVFLSTRTRTINITLANFEVLVQAKCLLEQFGIETSNIRNNFYDGNIRYKLEITSRDNLEKFRKEIHFVQNTKKYKKFEEIMNGYKEYHHSNNSCSRILLNAIKENKFSMTKNLSKLSGLHPTSVSRNLKKLRKINAINYKNGKGNTRYWFSLY